MSESSGQSKFVMGFVDAGRGIVEVFRSERNFRIHLVIAFIVVALGFFLSLSLIEWIAVIFCIALVCIAEMFNTAIEYLADSVHPEMDPGIRRAKDAGAGAVLIAAVAAAAVGAIVFLPKTWHWLTTAFN